LKRARGARGGVLLELLVAIAIFAAGAAMTLSALQSALDAVRRAEERAMAEDLAASRLAELDAGLVSIGELRSDRGRDDGDEAPSRRGLSVSLEILPVPQSGERGVLARARATVRVREESGAEGAVLVVAERIVRHAGERR